MNHNNQTESHTIWLESTLITIKYMQKEDTSLVNLSTENQAQADNPDDKTSSLSAPDVIKHIIAMILWCVVNKREERHDLCFAKAINICVKKQWIYLYL